MNNENNTVKVSDLPEYKAIRQKVKAFYDKEATTPSKVWEKATQIEEAALASLSDTEKKFLTDNKVSNQNFRLPTYTLSLFGGKVVARTSETVKARGPNTATKTAMPDLGESEKAIERYQKEGIWQFIAPEKKTELEKAALVEKTERLKKSAPAALAALAKVVEETTKEEDRGALYTLLAALVDKYTVSELEYLSEKQTPVLTLSPAM